MPESNNHQLPARLPCSSMTVSPWLKPGWLSLTIRNWRSNPVASSLKDSCVRAGWPVVEMPVYLRWLSARVEQLGTSGESHVNQTADLNSVEDHSSPAGFPNAGVNGSAIGAGVRQRAGSVDAFSNIEQNGTGAWAEVDQDGINNSSDIRQGNDVKRSGDRAFS